MLKFLLLSMKKLMNLRSYWCERVKIREIHEKLTLAFGKISLNETDYRKERKLERYEKPSCFYLRNM